MRGALLLPSNGFVSSTRQTGAVRVAQRLQRPQPLALRQPLRQQAVRLHAR